MDTQIETDYFPSPAGSCIQQKTNLEMYDFPFMGDLSVYIDFIKIGQGTYGEVFKARHRVSDRPVALKKVCACDESGIPVPTLRESRLLQLIKHENIINLIEVCIKKPHLFTTCNVFLYFVFEFCEHDLAALLSNNKIKFSLSQIKEVLRQLLNAIFYLHTIKVLHRDLKPANVLLTKTGVLKLADFGIAKESKETKVCPSSGHTNLVVTLWYRPPELLLGARDYGTAVDMWSVGCIMAEMWRRKPILQGASEQDQISLVMKLCGSITPHVWPGVEYLELYKQLQFLNKPYYRQVRECLIPYVNNLHAYDLLDKLLQLDPSKRIDANMALDHEFFWTDPMPSDLGVVLQTISNGQLI